MYFVCKFCGSRNVKCVGENGNPFDRRPQKMICDDCGRVLSSGEEELDALYKQALEQSGSEEEK